MTQTDTESQEGRPAQRRRTRKAIVDATARLLERGATPSVNEIAEAANVSRRTVYMYFPTLEQLLIDATLGSLSSVVDVSKAIEKSTDVRKRVEALARGLAGQPEETLRMGRTLVRLTAETPDGASTATPRRGYRRTEWIETALAPVRGRLTKKRFERLVSALSVLLGWEALIVLRDIRALPPGQEQDVIAWACDALVKAALEDAR
jgi:AcrR family transcriptional regulator